MMRLINVNSKELEDFSIRHMPPYAVMWHIRSEVNDGKKLGFQESGSVNIIWRHQSEKDVIKSFCERTKERGIDYAWMDTCCIDQSSSTGLLEAIDSISQWHRRAAIWCVYLENISLSEQSDIIERLEHIQWFTRGWTLQEYFAPPTVLFFDRDWRIINEKQPGTLLNNLSRVSHAGRDAFLRGTTHVYDVPTWSWSGLLTLNGNANGPFEVTYLKLERDPRTCRIFSNIPTTDIKSCHTVDGCAWISAMRGEGPFPLSEKAQSWSQRMLEIRTAKSGRSPMLLQNQESFPMKSDWLSEDRGPGAETLTCVDTSHFHDDDGIDDDMGTTSSDSCSLSWSEDSEISFRAKESLFKILNELVDSILQMFFQALVAELWGSVQVLQTLRAS
ncbi:heterokaryon incompatibility protein-domain-containing protein [Apiospora arundinis]|uniref:Heterokaryon incompatibility protein-domain-containing protein n=1 Tax=Apiospora arundinis TaxID=335852 RepID=A0ABR2I7J9_9PEZI